MKNKLLGIAAILTSLAGCTVYVTPPTTEAKQAIPSADPVITPAKSTTIEEVKSTPAPTKPQSKQSAKPVKSTKITPTATAPKQDFYIVQPRDTVFEVMRKTGALWTDIIRLNNLKAPKYMIYPEQRLRLK